MAIHICTPELKNPPGLPRFYTLKTSVLPPSAVFRAGREKKQKKNIQTSFILEKRKLYGIFIRHCSSV